MSHPIPPDAQRLADRLRLLAEEVESAARYGIPVPIYWSIGAAENSSVNFHATPEQFAAWADYLNAESDVVEYEAADARWQRVERVDVNGLALSFATSEPLPPANPFQQLTDALNAPVGGAA